MTARAGFIKGKRVRMLRNDESVDAGQVGTLLEDSDGAPWVEFDEPVRFPFPELGGKAGHCTPVVDDDLELIDG